MAQMTDEELDVLEEDIQDAVKASCGLIRSGRVDREGEYDTQQGRVHMVRITTAEGYEWELDPQGFRDYVSGYEHMVQYLFGRGATELPELREQLLGMVTKAVNDGQQHRTLAQQILELAECKHAPAISCANPHCDARDRPSAPAEQS